MPASYPPFTIMITLNTNVIGSNVLIFFDVKMLLIDIFLKLRLRNCYVQLYVYQIFILLHPINKIY